MESGSHSKPQTTLRQTHSQSPYGPVVYAKTFGELGNLASALLKQGGLDVGAHGPDIVDAFTQLPVKRQIQILNDLRVFCDLGGDRLRDGKGLSREAEIDYLCRFLRKSGLRSPSQDFLELIADGDVIEVYDINCTQIYRSWSVFKLCSYSLADLSVYPFDMLYDRPSWVLGKLMELVPLALSPEMPIIDFQAKGIREYPLRERLTGHTNTILFQMKYCTGILGDNSRSPEAFISTGSAQRLPEGVSRSLSFV